MKLLLLLFLLVLGRQKYITLAVTLSNTVINTASDYSLIFYRDINPLNGQSQTASTVPSDSIIQIKFPDSFTRLTDGSYSCGSFSCTMSTNVLTVTGYYASGQRVNEPSISFTVSNIINPGRTGSSGQFIYSVKAPNGTVIDQSPSLTDIPLFSSSVTLTVANFASCSLSTTGTVYSSGRITVTVVPTNPIPPGGYLSINLPTTWSNSQLSQQLIRDSLLCTAVSNVDSGVSCTFETTTEIIVAANGLTTSNNITSSFSFSFGNVILPPTVNPTDTITLISRLSNGDMIDRCTTTLTGVVEATIQSVSLAASLTTVSQQFTGQLSFINAVLLSTADTIKITIPSTIGLPNSINISSFSGFTFTTSGQVLTITNFLGNSISASNRITITMSNCVNPASTKPTDSISIRIERGGRAVQSGSTTYTATAGTLTASLQSSSRSANSLTASQLSVVAGSPLSIGSTLKLIYSYSPQSLTGGANVVQCTLTSSGSTVLINGATYTLSGGALVFSNFLPSAGAPKSSTINLNFSEFTNPPTTQPVSFSIATYASDGYLVDSGSLSYTATPSTITSVSLSSSSYTVLATATLTLTFTPSTSFTTASIITPADISQTNVQSTCTSNQPSLSSCQLVDNNLTFISSNSISGTTSLSWSVGLPNSFKTTGRFQVLTYSSGWLVESSTALLTLTMNTTALPTLTSVQMSSPKNSENSLMTVTVTVPSRSPSGTLRIAVPEEVVLNTGFTCQLNSITTACLLASRSLSLPITNTTTSYIVAVQSVRNPPSLEPTNYTLNVTIDSSDGFSSIFSQVSKIQNTQTANLVNSNLTNGVGFFAESTNLTLSANLNGNQAYILLTKPSSFPALTVPPCTGCTLTTDGLIRIATTTNGSFSVLLTLTTGKINTTDGFSISTYSSRDYLVQQGTTNTWYPKCTNCRDCSGTTCLNCYTDTSITANTILKEGTCVSQCDNASGYYQVDVRCLPCNSNCKTCNVTATNCTSCNSTTYLDPTTRSCVTTCPNKYYPINSTRQCALCVSPCETCTDNITCKSCLSGWFLFGSTCITQCTPDIYIQNTANRTCDACNTNCKTCLNTTFNCTSCDTTKPLYLDKNTSTCVSVCPTNLVVKDGVCVICDSPCLRCSITASNCTACNGTSSFPLLLNNNCIARPCPDKYFANQSALACQSCPSQCKTCTSATVCTSCQSTYYWFNGTSCVTQCPNGTYTFNNLQCISCNSTCQTCSNQSTCLTCKYPLLLYLGICYQDCPSGTYSNTIQCLDCQNSCSTCLTATHCLSCIANSYLYKTVCYQTCPDGTYASVADCLVCPTGCSLCTNSTYCTACRESYSMENSLCVTNCAVGISYQQVCYPCGLNCASCDPQPGETAPACKTCQPTYSRHILYCVKECPATTVSIDQVCQNCSVKYTFDCLTCNSSQCLSCDKGALIDGSCQPCPNGTFVSLNSCVDCPVECQTCQNNTYCQTCASGYYLFNFTCSTKCPADMIPAGAICIQCVPSCAVCDQETTKCLVCQPSRYVYEGGCVTSCPLDLVVSLNKSNCVTQTQFYKEYSQQSKIVYMPFSIGIVLLLAITLILRFKFPSVHYFTFALSIVSLLELAVWILFIVVEADVYLHGHVFGAYGVYCLAATFGCLLSLNLIQVCLFNKYLKHDMCYEKWVRLENNHKSTVALLSVSSCTNFKFFRIVWSKMAERSSLSMLLTSVNSLRPIDIISFVSLFFVTGPAMVGAAMAMQFSISQDQQYWVALDCMVCSVLGGLLTLIDLHHGKDYFYNSNEAVNVKNVYKLENDYDSDIKVQFQEDQHVQANNPTMGKTFFSKLLEEGRANQKSVKSFKMPKFNKVIQKKNQNEESQGELRRSSEQRQKQINLDSAVEISSQQQLIDTNEEQLVGVGNTTLNRFTSDRISQDPDQQSLDLVYEPIAHWITAKKFDEYGYEVKENPDGTVKKIDHDGYEIRIENGKHNKYNEQGYRIEKDSDGNIKLFDSQGYQIVKQLYGDGIKRYDQDGYEVRIVGGQFKKFDEMGYEVRDIDGFIRKYDSQGYEVREKKGRMAQFDEQGYEIRIKDGVLKRYDEEGLEVRVIDGQLKRFEKDGYEVRVINGKKVLFQEHGFRVQKNYYGGVTLFDEEGRTVVIDSEGRVTKYREDGLRVLQTPDGKERYFDKRNNEVIFDSQGNYQKIDPEGNNIWLDEYGREVTTDKDGNRIMYDLAGNTIQDDYLDSGTNQILVFEDEGDENAPPQQQLKENKKKAPLLKPNKRRQLNLEEQYNNLVGQAHEKFQQQIKKDDQNEEEMRLSQLEDINIEHIREVHLEEQLADMLFDERYEVKDEDIAPVKLTDLKEIRIVPKQELIEKDVQPIVQPIVDLEHFDEQHEDIDIQMEENVRDNQSRVEKSQVNQSKNKKSQINPSQANNSQARQSQSKKKSSKPEEIIYQQGQQEKIKSQKSEAPEKSEHTIRNQPPKQNKTKKFQKRRQQGYVVDGQHIKQPHDSARLLDQDMLQQEIEEPKSVRDVEVSQKTQINEGVEVPPEIFDKDPIEHQSIQLDRNMIIRMTSQQQRPLNGSQISGEMFDEMQGDHETKTEYRLKQNNGNLKSHHSQQRLHEPTLQNQIPQKKQKNRLYDPNEEIESLNSVDWQQQQANLFGQEVQAGRVKNFIPPKPDSQDASLAQLRPNIRYIEEQIDNKDTLSDYVDFHMERQKTIKPRYAQKPARVLNDSIEVQEDRLFQDLEPRRQRMLNQTPNPMISLSRTIDYPDYHQDSNKMKNLQKIYLQSAESTSKRKK